MPAIRSADDLRSRYNRPSERAVRKQLDRLDPHCRRFVELSPFVLLASSGRSGQADLSPRGGEPGFVAILDDRTLAIPDSPGNNRLDSLSNVVENPEVALLFLVPGGRRSPARERNRRDSRRRDATHDAHHARPATGHRDPGRGARRLPALRESGDAGPALARGLEGRAFHPPEPGTDAQGPDRLDRTCRDPGGDGRPVRGGALLISADPGSASLGDGHVSRTRQRPIASVPPSFPGIRGPIGPGLRGRAPASRNRSASLRPPVAPSKRWRRKTGGGNVNLSRNHHSASWTTKS